MKTLEERLLDQLQRELERSNSELENQRKKVVEEMMKDADYCTRWYIEDLIKIEHSYILLYKLVANVSGIVSGESKIKMLAEEFIAENIERLKGEIMRGYFITHSTCQMTVQASVFKQEAQSQYIEKISSILDYCISAQKEREKVLK